MKQSNRLLSLFDYLAFIISNITLCWPLVITFRLGGSSVQSADHNHRVIKHPAKLARQQARQGGSSIRKKVLLKPLVVYITVHQVAIVKQALTQKPSLGLLPDCAAEADEA